MRQLSLKLPYPSFTFVFLRQARGSKMRWHKSEKTNTQGITHQTPPQNCVGGDLQYTCLSMCCRNGISIERSMICFSLDEYLLCSFSLTNPWNLPNNIFMIWNSFSTIYLADWFYDNLIPAGIFWIEGSSTEKNTFIRLSGWQVCEVFSSLEIIVRRPDSLQAVPLLDR